ncbi:hypothetical protein CEXT_224181 [Caerostris extrusa]|uniref:Uncharacterized protein n=1 Tax=Caerostris extrusa TaxID=172846 RepID=A0AAV4T2K6_CAEEX|nr:hypothetical protein CEXT_224181 [Caerostris extrusa]
MAAVKQRVEVSATYCLTSHHHKKREVLFFLPFPIPLEIAWAMLLRPRRLNQLVPSWPPVASAHGSAEDRGLLFALGHLLRLVSGTLNGLQR